MDRMAAVKVAVLLLLAAVGSNAAPNTAECDGFTKKMSIKDLDKIYGDWVLVWSVADHDDGHSILANSSSNHVEFKLLPDNKTIAYVERNVEVGSPDSCATYFINTTKPTGDDDEPLKLHVDGIRLEKDGVHQPYNDTGDVDFYESKPDSLLMVYKTSAFRFFLSYRREGSHRDVEQHKADHDDHRKQVECLTFPHDKPYVYDGVADFCHKKSAPLEQS